jgi:hypothetical protein
MAKDQTEIGPEIFRCGTPITVAKLLRMIDDEPGEATIDIIPGRSPSLVLRGPLARQPELAPAEGSGAHETRDVTS